MRAQFEGCDFQNSKLHDLFMSEASFQRCAFDGASLRNSDLTYVDMIDCEATNMDLEGAFMPSLRDVNVRWDGTDRSKTRYMTDNHKTSFEFALANRLKAEEEAKKEAVDSGKTPGNNGG